MLNDSHPDDHTRRTMEGFAFGGPKFNPPIFENSLLQLVSLHLDFSQVFNPIYNICLYSYS